MNQCHLRRIIQAVFFIIGGVMFYLLTKGILSVAHEYCPYSLVCFGLNSIRMWHESGFMFWVYPITFVVAGCVTLLVLFVGRMFCGYICPIGALSEYVFLLNRSKSRFRRSMPSGVHRFLRWLPILTFLGTSAMVWFGMMYIYQEVCPVMVLSMLPTLSLWGGIIIGVILIGSFFVERFWCRYLCPYAGLMNIIQYLGKLMQIPRAKIDRKVCDSINCKNCLNYCSMGIELDDRDIVDHVDCINCRRCVRRCLKSDPEGRCCVYGDKDFKPRKSAVD